MSDATPTSESARRGVADAALTTDLIERQIDRAIDAADAVAAAIEDHDAEEEVVGNFVAPDAATIAAATAAVARLHDGQAERSVASVTPEPVAPAPMPQPVMAQAAVVAPAQAPVEEPVMAEAAIDQIDTMLAEMADDDFEHELEANFETVEQVTGTAEAMQDAAAEADAQEADMDGSFDSLEDLFGGQIPTVAPAPAQAEAAAQVSAPDQPQAAPPAQQAPQPDAKATPAAAPAKFTTPAEVPAGSRADADRTDAADEARRGSRLRQRLAAQARRIERGALQVCTRINRPMRYLDPEMRQTVGWVALAVAVPGVVFFTIGVLV